MIREGSHVWSLSHTLPYSVNDIRRRSKFSIRSSPSTCVSCLLFTRRSPFLTRRMRSLSGEVCSIRRKVLCMLKTWNRLHRTKASTGCMVAMRWHVFCSGLMCSLSCTCPVHIRWCPVDLIRGRTTTWHATGQPVVFRCNSLSCPHGQLAPQGASCPGLSYPPPWLSSPQGGQAVQAGLSCPPPIQGQ